MLCRNMFFGFKTIFLIKSKSFDMKKIIFGILISGTFAVSCTPKSVPAAESETSNAEKLAQGKTIFENSCGKCHDLPDPTAHSSVDWVGIMNAMAPKAKLTEEQHQLVYDYVVSVKK